MFSICFCTREFVWSWRSMNARQPTRWLKTNMTKVDTTMIKTNGKTHVGRWTIDSNVGLGLKITPKIRPSELTGFADSSGGITGLAIFSPPQSKVKALFLAGLRLRAMRSNGGPSVPRFRRISEKCAFPTTGNKVLARNELNSPLHQTGICGTAAIRAFV